MNNQRYLITASIVIYNNSRKLLLGAINSFLNTNLNCKLFLVDNSPTNILSNLCYDKRVEYIHNPKNTGFGGGHNIAIREILDTSEYHLILNPDIYFEQGVMENILSFLSTKPDVGVIMPNILYPNGENQFLAKLLPTPFDFFVRRFIPIKKIKNILNERFELRKYAYSQIIEAPFLSGCFLIFRTDVLKIINGFDENIFMYTEDIDICRRVIDANYKSIFYPIVNVYHDHERKLFNNVGVFKVYLKSTIYYFNKWGWIFDKKRKNINKKTLTQSIN